MSRNRGSGSGPFLMEMVIAAGFFMLCVAICVSAFVMADHLSRVGQDVNHGVLAAESLVERVKVGNTGILEPMSQMKSLEQSLKTGGQKIRRQVLYISL